MGVIDWVVFLGFLIYIVWDGVRRARGTRDLENYFAGGRSIVWWAAGLSIMATQASAITVIGTTGQGCEQGMEFVQTYFGLAFAMVLLSIFFVPLYRSQPILTAYQYLERRFGPATRTLASAIFLVSRCLAFAITIYAPAVVASAMLEIDVNYTIIALGALTTGYTMIGGVKAVIATDVKQMLVIIGGLVLVCFLLLEQVLEHVDFSGLLYLLGASGKLNAVEVEIEAGASLLPRWNEDFAGWIGADVNHHKSFWEDKYNLWSGMIGGLFLHLAYFGTDQSQVQRILTNPTAKESRMALLLSAFAKVPMQALVLFIGVLLYGFLVLSPHGSPMLFRPDQQQRAARAQGAVAVRVDELREAHRLATDERRRLAREIAAIGNASSNPERLRAFRESAARVDELRSQARDLVADPTEESTERRDVNYIFPYYILNHVPVVLLGLMMAAIFAAAMSSVDSALNSLTAATVVDFYKRLVNPTAPEHRSLWVSRWITVFWGACATVAAFYFKEAGSVIEVINKIGSFFYGSLLGVFLLALLCRRAGRVAGLFGLVGGMVCVLATYLTLQVEFLWYNVIGAGGVLAVGFVTSRFEATSSGSGSGPSPR